MVKIKIVCVGGLKEKFFADAAGEYIKRLKRFCSVEVYEIGEKLKTGLPQHTEILKALESEAAEILRQAEGCVLALDKSGRQPDSESFADLLKQFCGKHSALTFVIGGSHGLDENLKKNSDYLLSLGNMTFPHHLFRVMLLEQIYRAFMINAQSKYHK